jgi:hypothetical protein
MWHPGPVCPEEGRSSLHGWRALWARNWEKAISLLHPESGLMVLKDISNREGALLGTWASGSTLNWPLCVSDIS